MVHHGFRLRRLFVSDVVFWCLLGLFALLRGWNTAAMQMPFNGADAFDHIGTSYACRELGRMPLRTETLSPALRPFFAAHPHPAISAAMFDYAVPLYPGLADSADKGNAKCCRRSFPAAHLSALPLYEAQQTPLFYRLAALFFSGNDPAALLRWTDAVTVGNVVLFAGAILLWYGILLRALAAAPLPLLTAGTALLTASFSQAAFNNCRFSNDALSFFCGSLAVFFYVRFLKKPGDAWRTEALQTVLLGLLTGLAVMAKMTAIALVPTFCIALGWSRRGQGRRGALLRVLLLFVCGYLLVAGPYHLTTYLRYGQISGMQEALVNARHGYGVLDAVKLFPRLPWYHLGSIVTLFDNPFCYYLLPAVAGWSLLASPFSYAVLWLWGFRAATLLGAASLLVGRARRLFRSLVLGNGELVLLLFLTFLAMLFHTLHSFLAWGQPSTSGCYGMLVLPILLVGLLWGWAVFGKVFSLFALGYYFFLFNFAHYGVSYDLLTHETGVTGLGRALSAVSGQHSFLVTHPAVLFLEMGVLLVLALLCAGRILRFALPRMPRAGDNALTRSCQPLM